MFFENPLGFQAESTATKVAMVLLAHDSATCVLENSEAATELKDKANKLRDLVNDRKREASRKTQEGQTKSAPLQLAEYLILELQRLQHSLDDGSAESELQKVKDIAEEFLEEEAPVTLEAGEFKETIDELRDILGQYHGKGEGQE